MAYYSLVRNNVIIGFQTLPVLDKDVIQIEVSEELYNNAIEKGFNYYIYQEGEIVLNPNYEKEQEQKEKERISHLKCTKRVLALMLQEMGITYARLKEEIATNEQAQLEWDLCIELERSNPLLDIMGKKLGITPEQLDTMFKYANGEIDSLQ